MFEALGAGGVRQISQQKTTRIGRTQTGVLADAQIFSFRCRWLSLDAIPAAKAPCRGEGDFDWAVLARPTLKTDLIE